MQFLKKLFFGLNLTWPRIIVFAIVAGVVTGLIMLAPFPEYLSIRYIGITPEAWLLIGILICTNCEKPLEAAIKVFIFFLISQPIIYLVQWPTYHCFPWDYYRFWFYATLCTFPAGIVAWYIRKQNLVSAIIVMAASAASLIFAAGFILQFPSHFPYGLLAILFCLAQGLLYPFVLIENKRYRIASLILAVAIAVIVGVSAGTAKPDIRYGFSFEQASSTTFEVADESIATIEPFNEDSITIHIHDYGTTTFTATDANGVSQTYEIVCVKGGSPEVYKDGEMILGVE